MNFGTGGAQIHLAKIIMLDHALKGSYLNNVQFSVMTNNSTSRIASTDASASALIPAYTFYLSTEPTTWDDTSVFAVYSTPQGGGNGNLVAKRQIKSNDDSQATADLNIGPVHVWAECTDVTSGSTDLEGRVTLTAWGRMIKLQDDL